MANPEHLAKLKEGVEAWNEWRTENPIVLPDLGKSDLGWGANLGGANLTCANLILANLRGANLSKAKLNGVDISKATLDETVLTNTNLSEVKGLESCIHFGPSTLDHRTLAQSGRLPLVFLRDCGLSDRFIEYIPSLFNQAIQFYSCFISYSSKDQKFVERLHADLQAAGVRCWFAPEDLKIGDKFRDRIDESIRVHDKLMIVLSENSIKSPWVATEVESAFEREHREQNRILLFPIRLDSGVMDTNEAWASDIRRRRHIGDFSNWKDHDSYSKAFKRLLRDLTAQAAAASK